MLTHFGTPGLNFTALCQLEVVPYDTSLPFLEMGKKEALGSSLPLPPNDQTCAVVLDFLALLFSFKLV